MFLPMIIRPPRSGYGPQPEQTETTVGKTICLVKNFELKNPRGETLKCSFVTS